MKVSHIIVTIYAGQKGKKKKKRTISDEEKKKKVNRNKI